MANNFQPLSWSCLKKKEKELEVYEGNRRRILENEEEIDRIASELKISPSGFTGCLANIQSRNSWK